MEHTLMIERRESAEKRVFQKAQTAGVCRENGLRLFRKVNSLPFLEYLTDSRHLSGK